MDVESGQTDRRPALAADSPAPVAVPAASWRTPAESDYRRSLLDGILETTAGGPSRPSGILGRFLAERDPEKALALWLAWRTPPGQSLTKDRIARLLGQDIAALDELLTRQTNAIVHHPSFQRLEASWQGLSFLVRRAEGTEGVKIRVLNVSWRELAKDLERATEFDQSQLFRKVYSDEFDMPGGEPFGVLLGDYEIHPAPSHDHPVDDIATLRSVSQVAAAAFAPFITGAHPSMFGVEQFGHVEQPINLPRVFDQLDYVKWRSFRDTEDSRFVGLTLPRVLMRVPYADDDSRIDGFRFRETVSDPRGNGYLWGNAAYAFGAVLIRAYSQSGWLADIRGVRRGTDSGGLVAGLPVDSFSTDSLGVATKCSTDVIITDRQEAVFSDLGFIPLCHCKDTEFAAFYANHSVQKSKEYADAVATANARLSAMLQYTLCVSRFAHYLKSVAREKLGAFSEAEQCEDYLHRWLQQYVTPDSEASAEVKAKLPLREARVRVREHPEKPGCYLCVAHLWPHFELDELTTTLRVSTELTPARSS
jgi:type VI secretion system protein ImpD